jgi:L-aspartate oxidase
MKNHHLVVVGAGLAGLYFALRYSEENPDKKILILCKGKSTESNSYKAQGGVALHFDKSQKDSELHILDTLKAGSGINNKKVVREVIKNGSTCIKKLLEWKVKFDHDDQGHFLFGKEGGHSTARIIHSGDETGKVLISQLLKLIKLNGHIELREFHMATDLIVTNETKQQSCKGVKALNLKTRTQYNVNADFTILATGGIGALFNFSSNASVATGDGIAMASRVGAKIKDLEYIQFHPTLLSSENTKPSELITEAIRGEGAKLRSIKGELFLQNYDPRAELATRDIVSKAIFEQMKADGSHCVFLDCTQMDQDHLRKKFNHLIQVCDQNKIDPSCDMIPVVPGVHYSCGGIEVDLAGKTNVENLFAIGECSYTGLHGANRLASNSLLEAMVYGEKVALHLKSNSNKRDSKSIEHKQKKINPTIIKWLIKTQGDVRAILSDCIKIKREQRHLVEAFEKILVLKSTVEQLYKEDSTCIPLLELRNQLETTKLILKASLDQNENIGCFFKKNNPRTLESITRKQIG